MPPFVRPIRRPRPLSDAHAGRGAVCLQGCRIGHHGLLFAMAGGRTGHHPGEDAPVALALPTIARPFRGLRGPTGATVPFTCAGHVRQGHRAIASHCDRRRQSRSTPVRRVKGPPDLLLILLIHRPVVYRATSGRRARGAPSARPSARKGQTWSPLVFRNANHATHRKSIGPDLNSFLSTSCSLASWRRKHVVAPTSGAARSASRAMCRG